MGIIETLEELSHVWLHALAARNRFACSRSDRPLDNQGVDAMVFTEFDSVVPIPSKWL